MRSLSELYAALVLLAVALAVAPMVYSYVDRVLHVYREEPRPVEVFRLNETHAVCYAPVPVNISYWRSVGDFECWLVPGINSSLLKPCPDLVYDEYILVEPPWPCR